jgi:hypothetical protein
MGWRLMRLLARRRRGRHGCGRPQARHRFLHFSRLRFRCWGEMILQWLEAKIACDLIDTGAPDDAFAAARRAGHRHIGKGIDQLQQAA